MFNRTAAMANVRMLSAVICCMLLVCTPGRLAHFSYIGCFIDYGGYDRDITGLKRILQFGSYSVDLYGSVDTPSMSHELCSNICSLGGFLYFGLQHSSHCFCGDAYGSLGSAIESDCNMVCGGNSSQICGAGVRNSVFSLTYQSTNGFKRAERSYLTVSSSYNQTTHWNISARSAITCLFQCNSGCQAVIFSQQQQLCHLLRFALVPSALNSSDGEFYVRG